MNAVCASFLAQARACADLGSPLTARLCRLASAGLRRDTATGRRILDWPGETGATGAAVALRLMGCLHRLVLEGRAPDLAAAYAGQADLDDDALWAVVARHLAAADAEIHAGLARPPQTNEVRRSVPLAAIGHWLSARTALPLEISELGASAGLNLCWPDWRIETPAGPMGPADAPLWLTPEWRGHPPQIASPRIRDAAGVDLTPLDPVSDRLRMLSYIWADQPERLALSRAALDHAAAKDRRVGQGDAIDFLARRLEGRRPGALHLVCHTVAWQYFPAAAQARGEALLVAAGRAADREAPLARFAMEADGSGLPGAALTLDLWPEGRRLSFGRVDFHGRWIDWRPPQAISDGTALI